MSDTVWINQEVKPYLKYSAALHLALFAGAGALISRHAAKTAQTYRIDFIGPTNGILNREALESQKGAGAAQPQAAAAGKIAPLSNPDAFTTRHHAPLPRPSILSSLGKPAKPGRAEETPAPSEEKSAPAAQPGTPSGQSSGAPADASVSADMPNFPYPWYITRVRGELWQHWSQVMPSGGGEAMVEFSILRNGSPTDLRIESSSGDKAFDDDALASVQASAPFPPLPPEFQEPFLHVHVRFTSQ